MNSSLVSKHYFLWTKSHCPWCKKATELLCQKGLSHTTFVMDDYPEQLIEAKPLRRSYRFWFANVTTAAASILLTLFFMNFDALSRMSVNEESSNQIASAVNSNEAKNIALRSEEYITDHIMKVINEPSYMRTDRKFDLRNVGYQSNYSQGYIYTKGKENFTLRVEKSNFGLTKIRYWKHENKMIYLVPMSDGRLVTIYGNLSLNSAVQIAKSIK